MATKITVNGVTYDSIDALPPEARRLYELAMKHLPLAEGDGTGATTEVTEGGNALLHHRTVVQKKVILDGAAPAAKPSGITMSIRFAGPGITLRRSADATQPSGPQASLSGPILGMPTPAPIEPTGAGVGLRLKFYIGALAGAAFVIWLWMQSR